MEDVLSLLKKEYQNLTYSQKKIGKYIIDNFEEIPFMSSSQIGDKLNLSDVSIIRFSRAIGFKGYTDLKEKIKMDITCKYRADKRIAKSLKRIKKKNEQIKEITNEDILNLQEFYKTIELEDIKKATELVHQAKTIYLVGARSSSIVVDLLSYHMRRMSFDIRPVTEGGLFNPEKLISIGKGDLLIASCFPRYTKDTKNAIVLAKSNEADVICISDSKFSEISVNCEVVFPLKVETITFFNSYVVPISFCNMFLMNILEYDRDKVYKKFIEHNDKLLSNFDIIIE